EDVIALATVLDAEREAAPLREREIDMPLHVRVRGELIQREGAGVEHRLIRRNRRPERHVQAVPDVVIETVVSETAAHVPDPRAVRHAAEAGRERAVAGPG